MARLTIPEINTMSSMAPNWSVVAEDGVGRLVRAFLFDDFAQALAFTNDVGELAEAENHHPRLITEWGRVHVSFWSHEAAGIVAEDFEMARKVDALKDRFSALAR